MPPRPPIVLIFPFFARSAGSLRSPSEGRRKSTLLPETNTPHDNFAPRTSLGSRRPPGDGRKDESLPRYPQFTALPPSPAPFGRRPKAPRATRAPRATLFLCLLGLILFPILASAYESPTNPAPRAFDYPRDTYAFKNETVWNYGNGTVQSGPDSSKSQRQYTRRCFVLSRSTVQFFKFARFDPAGKPLDDPALAARIRDVTERSVWLPILPEKDRVVFPGYHDLREASADRPNVFRENLGLGWPIYFRPGNFPITVPVDRWTEARVNREIYRDLQENYPTIIWAYRFPSLKLNHVLAVFSCTRDASTYHYLVYDPNYDDRPGHLDYDIKTRSFSYQPTYYFKGGYVNVRAIYRGLFE